MLSRLIIFFMKIEPLNVICLMNYCGRNGHIPLSCFIRKNHENKNVSSSPHLYNKNRENNIRNHSSSSLFYDNNSNWQPRTY